ncbi:NAD(P)-dependent oxidoreductase [Clostridium sp. MT-14]|mgnify:FL=1|uniref:NAD(P)-dependent oxidoreductase n=1 Tax=unclassified Clostridium TaxID=2614128 RepID=UPI001238EF6B|nr:NAD(P)-dependent oxidoreductase [Clostridium sp. HV4-5-A1G]KAA8678119.1 D-2-hydroxyacid dehydrogenase [Clostridium sp. HV4-5-A1G]
MKNTVFLNSSKINFDGKINFSVLDEFTKVALYDSSSEDQILERVKDQNIVVTKELPLSGNLICKFPSSVKLICEAGTGYNNIDIEAARKKNIMVCNVPGYSTDAVAQLAITFILSLCSSITLQQTMLKEGNFSNFTKDLQVPHVEIKDKTLGIIGAGAIGQRVIKTALALDMKVLVYNRSIKPISNVKFVSLEELLAKSDFVSIHCPLTEDTKHLIDRDKFKLMKSTSFIINTARGAIINEKDLIEALQMGIIAGAALDVQEKEPFDVSNPLFSMKNVILTPHIGCKCIETRQRLVELLGNNIKAFINNSPINSVNS